MKATRFKRFWLVVALLMILVSVVGASYVQTSGWNVEIRTLNLVVGNDAELYAKVYIPKTASADHKLPLVVVQHGSQHNLEMQDMNMVELSRRG